MIGQGIGRWGNFVNQEAFGTNTTLPWGMFSEGTQNYLARRAGPRWPRRASRSTPSLPVHPTFLYESLWCLAGFLALFFYMKRRRFNGQLFLLYVIWYGLGRYWIEGACALIRCSSAAPICASASLWRSCRSRRPPCCSSMGCKDPKAARCCRLRWRSATLKKLKQAGARFAPESLPASAPHREFAAATADMDRRLAALDLDAPAPTPEESAPAQPAGPEADPQTAPEEKEDDDEREDH